LATRVLIPPAVRKELSVGGSLGFKVPAVVSDADGGRDRLAFLESLNRDAVVARRRLGASPHGPSSTDNGPW